MKCKNCGKDIPEDMVLPFTGTATVHGDASIESFRAVGIVWQVDDSENEEVKCPFCGELTPVS
jgi:ribosomal protein S26